MKKVEDFIQKMESSNVLMKRKYTFKEYESELCQFQSIICKMIAGNKYYENMRVEKARDIMLSNASKKGLSNHPAIQNCVQTLEKFQKEIATTVAGARGEEQVSGTLESLQRPNVKVFHNVYITDGEEETEVDDIVLTDDGIIILEVKETSSDVTLTEDGRMVYENGKCYGRIPLADSMELKRRLLRTCMEKALAEKDLDIPVFVDSFIVFTTNTNQYIQINDNYEREKWCYRTGCYKGINVKIEKYRGSADYTADQLTQLGEICSEMEHNVKRFGTSLNYDKIRRSIAEALTVLQDEQEEIYVEIKNVAGHPVIAKVNRLYTADIAQKQEKTVRKIACEYAIAGTIAGVIVSSLAAVLIKKIKRV